MRKTVAGILITISLLQSPAFAMGSGNKYQDAQTGVSYQIFQPSSTGDLLLRSFNMQSCGAKNEQWLAAIYGEDRSVQFLETDAALLQSAGVPTVLIGPTGGNLHSPNEWVEIAEVVKTVEVLKATIVNFLS